MGRLKLMGRVQEMSLGGRGRSSRIRVLYHHDTKSMFFLLLYPWIRDHKNRNKERGRDNCLGADQ